LVGLFGYDGAGLHMIDAISFLIYRIKVSFYLMSFVKDMNLLEAFNYSEALWDQWFDEEDPCDAVLEELSYWDE
jgi:hypothetical protein